MNIKIVLKRCVYLLFAAASLATFTNCQPEETTGGNPLENPNADATFTVTPVSGSANRFTVSSPANDLVTNVWDFGDGVPPINGHHSQEVFYPDAGVYTVTHTACAAGGLCNSTTQNITVATSDPAAGNLIVDGNFTNGQGAWQILNISASGAAWTFSDGKAIVNGSGFNQQGIYQAVQVEANKPYAMNMLVSGAGSTDTWFEVFISPTAPVQGQDYSANGIRFALNTWAGCATSPFNGLITSVGCGDHSGNPITFATAGTVYFVIKSGGGNVNSINVDNVELRGVN